MLRTTSYVIFFVFAMMVGWVIDSGYRSIVDRKWTNAGYFIGPICPIYGFGGVLLLILVSAFGDLPFLARCCIYFVGMSAVEFFGGLFSTHVLKVKLWDYSDAPFNIMGQVDLLHSFYWLILALAFEGTVWPIIDFLNENTHMVIWVDRLVLASFMIFFSGALLRKMAKERSRVKPFRKEGAPKVLWKHLDKMNENYEKLMGKLDKDIVIPSERATKRWFDEHEHYLNDVNEGIHRLREDTARIRHRVPTSRMERELRKVSRLIERGRADLERMRGIEGTKIKDSEEYKQFKERMEKLRRTMEKNTKRASPLLSWRSYIKRRGRSLHPKAFLDRFPAWQSGWKKRKDDLMTLLRSDKG